VSERLEDQPQTVNSDDAELARLRQENDLLRMERDILKKAIGIFSRMPQ
jgi:transposase-like protein